MKRILISLLLTAGMQCAFATVYYVSTSGNDGAGNGSSANPWRTLKYAVTRVAANQGHVIKLSAGTFVESGQFNVPPGVSIDGAGVDQTFVKAASSFYYNPGDPGFALDKFLMALQSDNRVGGNQSLKNFTIDGDGKKLHGGIYVKNRDNVTIENIKVQYTNFSGIWLWDVRNSVVRQIKLLNCTWASTGWAAGALQLANLENVEIDRADIDENVGYGVKALGSGGNKIVNLKLHDSRVSVVPAGKWNNGSAPNISIELWSVELVGCELYNTYMDNHLSLVANLNPPAPQTIRVYNNVIDLMGRAGGNGYGIELSMSNAEIDHNWIRGGSYGIAHWSSDYMSNWKIHHNTFYGLSSGYPGDVIRAQKSGLHNVKVYNNTVEFTGTTTVNFIGLHGGASDNVEIKNNLIINSNTSYNWFPNQLIFMENGATLSALTVSNNLLENMPVGNVAGTYSNNKSMSAQVTKVGDRPNPYYVPAKGSPLIDAGLNLGFAYQGSAPDIGCYESGASVSPVAVTGISVSPSAISLTSGQTTQLTKTITPSNATNQNVTWTSSNTAVATVNANGLVSAGTTAGVATITVKTSDGNKTANSTVTVTVQNVAVTGVSVAPSSVVLPVSGTSQLTNAISPANATNKSVTWTSSNASVATVSATGLVTAKALGTAVVSCVTTDGQKAATSAITVSSTIQAIEIDNAQQGTGVNQFNFSGAGWTHASDTADPYFNKTVSFSNVSGNTATIAFTGNKVELYSAKASHHGIVAISIDNGPETQVDLYASARQNLALVFGSNGLTQGNHTIKMRVTGNKNASASGAYVILDYAKVYSGTSTSTAVSGVTVSPSSLSLSVNATGQLSKTISPANAANQSVSWSSSNSNVAAVNASGLVTGIAAGTAVITATTVDGGKTASATITVTAASNGVDIDNSVQGTAANQFNFSGTGWTHAANTADPYFNRTVSFSNVPGDAAVITFSGNKVELYSAKAAHHGIVAISIDNGPESYVDLYASSRQNGVLVYGSAVLTQGNHTIKMRVTGTKNTAASGAYVILDYVKLNTGSVTAVTGIAVSPSTLVLNVDAAEQLTKSITPSAATNQNVTWSSNNTAVAIVNANGLVTGVSPGTAVITVKTADGGKTATASVTVNPHSNARDFDNANRGTATNQFNYTGSGWSHVANSGDPYFDKTVSFSNVVGDAVSVSFVGNKIEFYSSKAAHHGIVAISVDNGAETLVDLYAAARQSYAMVFSSGNLTQGDHVLKIRVTGNKNGAATGTYAIVDYVKIYSTATGSGSGAGAPVATTAATDEEARTPIQYYPNPLRSGDALHVTLPEAEGQVTLTDIGGVPQRTLTVSDTELQIPTDGLMKGIYLLQYRSVRGREVVKIMIH